MHLAVLSGAVRAQTRLQFENVDLATGCSVSAFVDEHEHGTDNHHAPCGEDTRERGNGGGIGARKITGEWQLLVNDTITFDTENLWCDKK